MPAIPFLTHDPVDPVDEAVFKTPGLPVPETVTRIGSVMSGEVAENDEGEKEDEEDHGCGPLSVVS
jgi:hypothetical protein